MSVFDFLKGRPDPPARPSPSDIQLAREIFAQIEADTARPVVRCALEEGEPSVFESKVGGVPYLPHGEPWPLDRKGGPMDLLAQIDCAALSGLPGFPHAGLLQFFLARNDVYGVDLDDGAAQTGFRVFFRERVDRSVTAEEVRARRPAAPADGEEHYSPVLQPCRMVFCAPETQGITQDDYRFDALFVERWNARRPGEALKRTWDFFDRFPPDERPYHIFEQPAPFRKNRHRLGGYPSFTQDDPRYQEKYRSFDVLLFQLDSDFCRKRDRIMWGDCGVGNFFISPEDLKSGDFSRVLYNWDCG